MTILRGESAGNSMSSVRDSCGLRRRQSKLTLNHSFNDGSNWSFPATRVHSSKLTALVQFDGGGWHRWIWSTGKENR